jgi:hypothetical protein
MCAYATKFPREICSKNCDPYKNQPYHIIHVLRIVIHHRFLSARILREKSND